jgi:hypothetical protein
MTHDVINKTLFVINSFVTIKLNDKSKCWRCIHLIPVNPFEAVSICMLIHKMSRVYTKSVRISLLYASHSSSR